MKYILVTNGDGGCEVGLYSTLEEVINIVDDGGLTSVRKIQGDKYASIVSQLYYLYDCELGKQVRLVPPSKTEWHTEEVK
jgi:hypothetical protein